MRDVGAVSDRMFIKAPVTGRLKGGQEEVDAEEAWERRAIGTRGFVVLEVLRRRVNR